MAVPANDRIDVYHNDTYLLGIVDSDVMDGQWHEFSLDINNVRIGDVISIVLFGVQLNPIQVRNFRIKGDVSPILSGAAITRE